MIEAGDERMPHVLGVQLPRAVDDARVLAALGGGERGARRGAMRPDRHDVGRAVRQPDAGARQRDLHHVLREVARRMQHVLMRGRDAARRRVVVGPEMRRDDAAAAFGDEPGSATLPSAANTDCVVSIMISKLSDPFGMSRQYSNASHADASAATCSGVVIFGSMTTKFGGSAAGALEQPREEQIEGPQAAALQLLAERLDADADALRQRSGGERGRHLVGRCLRDAILPRRRAGCRSRPRSRGGSLRPARASASRRRADRCGRRSRDRGRSPRRAPAHPARTPPAPAAPRPRASSRRPP